MCEAITIQKKKRKKRKKDHVNFWGGERVKISTIVDTGLIRAFGEVLGIRGCSGKSQPEA